MVIRKIAKKTSIFIIIFLVINCDYQQDNYKKEEIYLLSIYNYGVKTGLGITLESLAQEVENYFLEYGITESTSKESYKKFFDVYVLGNSMVEFELLHRENQKIESLYFPSNVMRGWYAYDQTVKRFTESLDSGSSIIKLHKVLTDIKKSKFNNEELFELYFNSVSKSEFESKIIYRMPLIIFSYAHLVNKIETHISNRIEREIELMEADTLFSEEDLNTMPTAPE